MAKKLTKWLFLIMVLSISLGSKIIFADEGIVLLPDVKMKVEGKLIESELKRNDITKPYYFLKTDKGDNVELGAKDSIEMKKLNAKDYVGKNVVVTGMGSPKGDQTLDNNGKVISYFPFFGEIQKIELNEKKSEIKKNK